jgi:hypothetical protein
MHLSHSSCFLVQTMSGTGPMLATVSPIWQTTQVGTALPKEEPHSRKGFLDTVWMPGLPCKILEDSLCVDSRWRVWRAVLEAHADASERTPVG